MRRYAAAPLDNGRFDLNNEVKTASDASMNDDLPLLLEQTNEFLFDIDIASDALFHVIKIADNSVLFGEGW